MKPKHVAGGLALAAALMLVGAGCTAPFAAKPSANAPQGVKEDKVGQDLSEQADIITNAAVDEASLEEGASGNVEEDASLFTSDQDELNSYQNSYEDTEL